MGGQRAHTQSKTADHAECKGRVHRVASLPGPRECRTVDLSVVESIFSRTGTYAHRRNTSRCAYAPPAPLAHFS